MTYSEVGEKTSLKTGGYEAPQLTPIGNLRDLLATGTGSGCDEAETPGSGEPGNNVCP
jgi:hypothetical protein